MSARSKMRAPVVCRTGLSLVEILLVGVLTVLVMMPLSGAFSNALRISSINDPTRDLLVAANWGLQTMLEDIRRSTEVLALGTDRLVLATQYREDTADDFETIAWERTAGIAHTRQVDTTAPVTYVEHVTRLAFRGPRLWTQLDGEASVTAPALGPAGTCLGAPVFTRGLFDSAVLLSERGQQVSFPATVLSTDRGALEFWVDFRDLVNNLGNRSVVDTDPGVAGQRLSLTCESRTGRLQAAWGGTGVIDFTPNPLEYGWNHVALAWDALGNTLGFDDSGRRVSLALYLNGVRCPVPYTGALGSGAFTGQLYVGTSNAPNSGSAGSQSNLLIDNFKVYSTAKSGYSERLVPNDMSIVEARVDLTLDGRSLSLQGSAQARAGGSTLAAPPRNPWFPCALQSEGDIDADSGNIRTLVDGDVHADGTWSYDPGRITIDGDITFGEQWPLPVPDMAAYRAAADHVVTGDMTFSRGTYNGVYYITGNAFFDTDVTLNGTVVTEGGIYKVDPAKLDYIYITPDRPSYPAMIGMSRTGGRSTSIDLNELKFSELHGLIYGGDGVSIHNTKMTVIEGAIASAGTNTLTVDCVINTSLTYSMPTTPPFFYLP